MKSYREAHVGQDAGLIYDRMHEERVDALVWRNFVKPYIAEKMQNLAAAGATNYLDFACGTGRILKVGASIFPHSTGIDISADMLLVAEGRVPNAKLYRVDVTKQPAAIDDLAKENFDCVTMFRFLLNAEPQLRIGALAWVADHMHQGAVLIINNHRSTTSAHGVLAKLSSGDPTRETNVLSRKSTIKLIEESGFEIQDAKGFRILPSINGKPLLGARMQLFGERVTQKLGLGSFGAELVFVAKKR